MARFAQRQRTFFVEEPCILEPGGVAHMEVTQHADGPFVCVPWLPAGLGRSESEAQQRTLLHGLLRSHDIRPELLWFYTPMALGFASWLEAPVVVYDCMDELSGFRGAPAELIERERALFARADLVFTGGHSLYRAKRGKHPAVFACPSSVDARHFAAARGPMREPDDQRALPGPRVGYFGVIDERIDVELVAAIAEERPALQVVMVGPVVKIDPATLPRRANLHWLGGKSYGDLPAYLAGWDVAFMPFARNESTEFISPTKTLEYLAAGRPVVSTAITDVVHPYGDEGLVRIADRADFVAQIDAALVEDPTARRAAADAFVARTSWDATFAGMAERIDTLLTRAPLGAVTRKEVATCSTT